MPIYEYHCRGCGENFEELVLSKSSVITCPKCHGSEVEKLMSATSLTSNGKNAGSSSGSSCSSCSATSCSSCKSI